MVRKIGLGLLLATVATAASATETCKIEYLLGFIPIEVCTPSNGSKPVAAPEIDPASAMAGLTLMAGGLAVLRSRRRRNTEV